MDPKYDDCPFECQTSKKRWDATRTENCRDCMRTRLRAQYARAVRRTLTMKLGADGDRHSQADLDTAISVAAASQDVDPRLLSYKVGIYVDAYQQEKARADRRTE